MLSGNSFAEQQHTKDLMSEKYFQIFAEYRTSLVLGPGVQLGSLPSLSLLQQDGRAFIPPSLWLLAACSGVFHLLNQQKKKKKETVGCLKNA